MERIGSRIRVQRLLKNYSQEYMSFMLEISQAAYSNIESGKTEITLRRIYEIAEVLEISPFHLMPQPKFGLSVFFGRYVKTMFKLKAAYSRSARKKHEQAVELGIVYRDTSKNLD